MGVRRRNRLWAVIALWMVVMIAAGCSGSESSSVANDSALTDSVMVDQSASQRESFAETSVQATSAPAATMDSLAMDQAAPEEKAESEANSAAGSGGGGFGSDVPAATSQPGRMLIYRANLTMETESYSDAYSAVQDLIHLSGGYIVEFSEQTSGSERSGYFTVKVPAGDFNGFLQKLEEIPHKSLKRSMNAQDVSEEFVDLEARLKAKQVVEQRLLSFMEKATGTDDLVRFSNELAAVQEEVERLKGRMRFLEQNVAFSTVELRVYEKVKSASSGVASGANIGERMGEALRSSLNVLVSVVEGVMVIIAGAIPIALVGGLIGVPIYWGIRRRSQKAQKTDL